MHCSFPVLNCPLRCAKSHLTPRKWFAKCTSLCPAFSDLEKDCNHCLLSVVELTCTTPIVRFARTLFVGLFALSLLTVTLVVTLLVTVQTNDLIGILSLLLVLMFDEATYMLSLDGKLTDFDALWELYSRSNCDASADQYFLC